MKVASTKDFHRSKNSKDGFYGVCKKCRRKKSYSERETERARNYYKDNKKIMIKNSQKYYKENKGHVLERSRKYRVKNYEKVRRMEITNRIKYRKEKPWLHINRKQIRRARKRNLPSTLTQDDWLFALDFFDNSCAYCGNEDCSLQREHVIPVVKRGGYTPENIIPACASCNPSKGTNDLEKWFPTRETYTEERLERIYEYMELNGLNKKEFGNGQLSLEL